MSAVPNQVQWKESQVKFTGCKGGKVHMAQPQVKFIVEFKFSINSLDPRKEERISPSDSTSQTACSEVKSIS